MNILEKFSKKRDNLKGESPVAVAFLGDSVTQGCFADQINSDGYLDTTFDAENAYHTKFRKIFNLLYPNVPLNIINAGISGGNAVEGLERLERDVLRFNPDLCVVCFGLNDSVLTEPADMFEKYQASLDEIFKKLKERDIEVIFMTPNMMCTKVCGNVSEVLKGAAETCSKVQTEGRLDMFINAARDVAKRNNVPICDCYAKWKLMSEKGVNTNDLLEGPVNHPNNKINWMFAYSLVETIFMN